MDEVRNIYYSICNLIPDSHFSLVTGMKNGLQKQLDEALSGISPCKQVEQRVFECPTPWHVGLLGLQNLLGCISQEQRSASSPLVMGSHGEMSRSREIEFENLRVVFRGVCDVDWEESMVPSIYRRNTNKKEQTRVKKKFDGIIKNALGCLNLDLPVGVFDGAAQHYGIATKLLDFTADPFVATWFANHGKTRKANQCAAVYMLPLRIFMEEGGEIILPPPFIERLYLQRGVFVRLDDKDELKKQNLIELRFPFAGSTQFEIRRGGKAIELLDFASKIDEPLKNLIENLKGDGSACDLPNLESRIKDNWGSYDSWYSNSFDLINWLGGFGIDPNLKRVWTIPSVLGPVVRSNKPLVKAMVEDFKAFEGALLRRSIKRQMGHETDKMLRAFARIALFFQETLSSVDC